MFSKEDKARVNKARVIGTGKDAIYLEDGELLGLLCIILQDVGSDLLEAEPFSRWSFIGKTYYEIDTESVSCPCSSDEFVSAYRQCVDSIQDVATYFTCLAELHKRRRKYRRILREQPIPNMEQVVPRGLLEYGLAPPDRLASWLVWRKWLYDIDNRAAQETGYLFEPILAASIGGVPYSAKKSPIKRTSDSSKGRQVDCIDGRDAYEFKMRVTIAASGQGRFQEELDFATDCKNSGFRPILLVLDPTPSSRLTDLAAEFGACGGLSYIGDDAWNHLEERAGKVMGKFIEHYIKVPIAEITKHEDTLKPISICRREDVVEITIGDHSRFFK